MACGIITAEPFLVLSTTIYVAHTLTMPQFMIDLVCQRSYNKTICGNLESGAYPKEQDDVHQVSAFWMGALLLCSLCPSVITIVIWGPLGDIFGRSKVMTVPPLFMLLQCVSYVVISSFKDRSPHPALLLIGSFLSSVYGESQGVVALANSYMADISVAEGRTLRIGILESCMFLAIAISSILSGTILSKFGYSAVFVMTGVLSVLNFIYTIHFHTSSQAAQRYYDLGDEQLTIARFSGIDGCGGSIGSVFLRLRARIVRLLWGVCSTRLKRKLVLLLVAFTLAVIPSLEEIMLGVLYIKHYPFNFKAMDIGIFASTQSVLRGVAVLSTYGVFVYWLKFSDYLMIILGLSCQILYYILVGLSRSAKMLYVIQILGMMMPLPYPALRSAISKQVDHAHHGSLIAFTEAVDAMTALLTSLLANTIYAATVSLYSGFFSFLLALFSGCSLIISCILYAREDRSILFKKGKDCESTKLINSEINQVYSDKSTNITSL